VLVLTEDPLKKLILVAALVYVAPNCFAQLSQDQAAVATSGQTQQRSGWTTVARMSVARLNRER